MLKTLGLISLVLAVAVLGYFIYRVKKILGAHVVGENKYKINSNERLSFLILSGICGVFLVIGGLFLCIGKNYELKVYEYFELIFGLLIFGFTACFGTGAFMLYYYKLDLDEKQRKVCEYAWPISIVVILLSLILFTTSFADYIVYPLVSGVDFSNKEWLRGPEMADGFGIKFYGILIVSGALLCYAITDHMTYQKFKRHGLIDTLFVVAFLFGILGARLWYCLVLDTENFISNPASIFTEIMRGGLAIQGGAILGIVSGVTFMLLFRKYIDVRFMMDVAIPTILLAQCIGRWGNFFNQEVFGATVSYDSLWYLPKIVRLNMNFYNFGEYKLPLFFIEGTLNLCGYFFIRYFLGKVCKFHVGLGYQASFYLIWYGSVRSALELLRDSEFKYMRSFYISFAILGAGVLMFIFFFVLHKIRKDKGIENEFGDKIKEV